MMPFPWFLSLLLCSLSLWATVCALSSYTLLQMPAATLSGGCQGEQNKGWLKI